MPPPCLVLALALAVPAADPTSLVRKLGSDDPGERRAAAASLEALGRGAIPALRAARRSKETSVRERAAEVLAKLEPALLIRPTLVRLDFQDRPLPEVVGAIGRQAGIPMSLEPADDPGWRSQRVTLRESQPVTFWEALDRLGAAGQVRHDPGFPPARDGRGPVVRFRRGSGSFPKSFSGPFRVNLLRIHRGHELAFGPEEKSDDEEEPVPERFEVIAQVFAEPHLLIGLNGGPKEIKARDDFDQDLIPPPPAMTEEADDAPEDAPPDRVRTGDAPVPGTLSIVQFAVTLRSPDRIGTTIERLEGVIPLRVVSRRPDPLVVPLAEAPGKTFENEEVVLAFGEEKPAPSARTPLRFLLTMKNPAMEPAGDPEPSDDEPESQPVDTLQNRLEIVDESGRPMIWGVRDARPVDGGAYEVTIGFSTHNGGAAPKELHYYSLVQAAIEVPFQFARVPLP